MAKSTFSQAGAHRFKVNVQHVLVMIILFATFYALVFLKVIPWGAATFVLPLFQPSQETLEKTGFIKFKGLVWASTPKDIADKYRRSSEDFIPVINKEANKEEFKLNRDYIFDFTWNKRTVDKNGYAKGAWEFYAKTEILGENAIILEPIVGFWILALVLSLLISLFITIVLPTNIGLLAVLFDRQIDNTKVKIRLQTGFSDDIVELLITPDDKLIEIESDVIEKAFRFIWERTVTEGISSTKQGIRFEEVYDDNTDVVQFRNESIYGRIKEYFSDFLVKEIEDTKDGLLWRRNHFYIGKGLRLYMAHHFTEKYANNVTGMAYGGAAVLIVAIGIRGLKFIPPTRPSFILFAIFLEFSMLTLLAVTLFYTEEEERMDKMLKKMEDANRSQLEILKGQQYDIHQLTNALVGQTAEIIRNRVENAISEYMTSDNNVHRVVADEISKKILIGIRDSYSEKAK